MGTSVEDGSEIQKLLQSGNLTAQERARYLHQQMHEKHAGHESMHAWMILILLFTVIVSQVLLVEWKKRYNRSYQRVSLVALWIVPLAISAKSHWMRFIVSWVLFTLLTCIVISRAIQKPITGMTPRLVYKWFYFIYMLSYALGVVGYVIVLLTLLGVNLMFRTPPQSWMDCGLLCLFYGLYYGVLGRDISEIITDKMAATIGYYTTSGIPDRQLEPNICAVCGNVILVQDNSTAIVEKTYNLTCGHTFHEFCIRGWCIVGKKQTCPYCKEKVDLKRMFCNPWEKPHVFYGSLLDFIRYLVAWQPVIFFAVQMLNYVLGLE
ncbi:LOW QUALITY PROTEIN: E3 ubiquitin ligase Rnf121-like [Uloborus diversus]|uniref:LOW QUALITY PROTEIN: E3 ubiquitin ligase Rnf121-like n=1 Tax=Uloborus diversus TaxID=327109 RepID=UPI00240A4987|nr:LOW QUALITY PROTEIN: E3 ubiquitin ligase Rnf121-like [Uloborus diversus]